MKITHTNAPTSSSSKPHELQPHRRSPRKTLPDLPRNPADRRPTRRKISAAAARTPRLHPRRKDAASTEGGRRAGPPTPLLRWKFDEAAGEEDLGNGGVGAAGEEEEITEEGGGRKARRSGKAGGGAVSTRKLAAALWRSQAASEYAASGGGGGGEERKKSKKIEDRLGLKGGAEHLADWLASQRNGRGFGNEGIDLPKSPCSVNGPINGYSCKPQDVFNLSNYAMEGMTKWDPVHPEVPKERSDDSQSLEKNLNSISIVSTLQAELGQARARIEELESERRSSKKKLEHFLRKLSEERAAWRSREHEKVRVIIDDIKSDLSRERKNRQRLEIVNSKLVNELAESKLSAKRYLHDYDKERKNRELVEEVCDELAKEIGEDRAEVDALKKECLKMREEVDDERKMLQMAEVWREERVQMKLIDAKVTLEDKFSQMNKLIADLEQFLKSNGVTLDSKEVKEADKLMEAAGSVKIHDIKEFTYEPPKSDDLYAVFEEMAMMGGEISEKEIEPYVSYSPASHSSKIRTVIPKEEASMSTGDDIYKISNVYRGSHDGDFDDDDRSGWETVSRADDQGSSYSLEGSTASVSNKKMILHRNSNVSVGSGTDWEENGDETPFNEISEVCSVRSKQRSKKVTSISRLWRSSDPNGDSNNYKIVSLEGVNGGRFSNGRVSNGGIMSPDCASGKGSEWSPCSDAGNNPAIGRGMKGCIELPRGHKHSLKAKLLEARLESQKIQLRQVLKQKI